jgi:hypothetical protein
MPFRIEPRPTRFTYAARRACLAVALAAAGGPAAASAAAQTLAPFPEPGRLEASLDSVIGDEM